MEVNVLSTQNWSRAFSIWIEDIQVVCSPVVTAPSEIQACILRQMRQLSRYTALVLSLFFILHCTKPQVAPSVPVVPEPLVPDEPTTEKVDPKVYTETGRASWYGGDDGFAGQPTANGEIYNPQELTCAHRTLPFNTRLEVKNLDTGKKAVLRVNDRGPYIRGRMLDVSEKAARALGMHGNGTARVRIRTVTAEGRPAPMDPVVAANPYTIQVAALSDPSRVSRLCKELQSAIGPVNLVEAQTKGGVTVKRVRVGTYDNLEDAQKAAEQIAKLFKDRGLDPFITREY